MRPWWRVAIPLVLAGCVNPPPDHFCAKQPLSECFNGRAFSDCGGPGPPIFACSEDLGCRWFSGGCAARDFVASPCAADNICCIDHSPFSYDPLEDGYSQVLTSLSFWFLAYGLEPWDRDRAVNLTVSMDPGVDGTAPMRCEGDYPDPYPPSPCMNELGVHASTWLQDTLTIQIEAAEPAYAGVGIDVEIIPGLTGGFRARACTTEYTDFGGPSCPREPPIVYCANSGTVTIDHWPTSPADSEGLTGTIDLAFDDFSIAGGFKDRIPP